jgi:hypothetical protein
LAEYDRGELGDVYFFGDGAVKVVSFSFAPRLNTNENSPLRMRILEAGKKLAPNLANVSSEACPENGGRGGI